MIIFTLNLNNGTIYLRGGVLNMMTMVKRYILALKTTEGRVLITMLLLFEGLSGSLFSQFKAVNFAGASIIGAIIVMSIVFPTLLVSIVISKVCKNLIGKPDPTY